MVRPAMARLPRLLKLVLESLDFSITADIDIFGIIRELFLFPENVCCVNS